MTPTLTKAITAKQHVVPQLYLRRFTGDTGSLEIYQLDYLKFGKPKSTAGIGYDLFFYAQTTGIEDDLSQGYEAVLQCFEDFVGARYDGICERILSGEGLTAEDRDTLSIHACSMWLRGYGMRLQIEQSTSALMKKVTQIMARHPATADDLKQFMSERQGREVSDEEAAKVVKFMQDGNYSIRADNLTHLQLMQEYRGFANLLNCQKLRIYIAGGARRFITSDCPVSVLYPHYARPFPGTLGGLGFTQRLHALPLTSRILLEFHDPAKVPGEAVEILEIPDEFVLAANARQFAGARKWCAGVSREDFCVRTPVPRLNLPRAPHVGMFDENHMMMKTGS